MSEPSKSFSLRLSPEDHVRLEQVAARFSLDRTGALRLLIRRAVGGLARNGCFTPVNPGRAGREIPLRLIERKGDDHL